MANKLLAISYEYYPQLTPLAIRSCKILDLLAARGWEIELITADENKQYPESPVTRIYPVAPEKPPAYLNLTSKLRMSAVNDLANWPDDKRWWIEPCLRQARDAIEKRRPDAILIFLMPYSAGLVGSTLRKETGIPVVLNFDDSPTCSDMHASFSSYGEYAKMRDFEDDCVRSVDAVIYVSEINMNAVRMRLSEDQRDKFHLIRCGADPSDYQNAPEAIDNGCIHIVYTGGMSGWYEFYHSSKSVVRNIYHQLQNASRHHLVKMDWSSSSPVYIGRAARDSMRDNPELRDKISVDIYGNRYPAHVVERVLTNTGICESVKVYGPISNREAISKSQSADLLLIALPDRLDNTRGGRISCKTYEYLMTDRPILAAVPKGENWDYLEGKPGVFLVKPTDVEAMQSVITDIAKKKLSGEPMTFDRSTLAPELNYQSKIDDFNHILSNIIK